MVWPRDARERRLIRWYGGVAFTASIVAGPNGPWWWDHLLRPALMMTGVLVAIGRTGPPIRPIRFSLRLRVFPLHVLGWCSVAVVLLATLSGLQVYGGAGSLASAPLAAGLMLVLLPLYHLSLLRRGAVRPEEDDEW